jgi:ribonuclease P protein component
MLTHIHRFHGHGSLRYVYKNGHTVRGRLVSVRYTINARRRHSRVSVVVSKKVLKSAVGRNRIRRRLYEIIRTHLPNIHRPYDIVLLVGSHEVATVPHQQLEECIRHQLQEAGILPSPTDENSGIL